MNDTTKSTWIRRLTALIIVASPIAIGAWFFNQKIVQPVGNGERITSLGQFRSPSGTTVLTLEPADDGRTVNVLVKKKEGSPDGASASWTIDGTGDWYFILDPNDKLWGYSSDVGPHSWQATSEGVMFTNIGIFGGWNDAPKVFLDSLPKKESVTYSKWLDHQQGNEGSNPG